MVDTGYTHGGDGAALKAPHQHPAEGIAKRGGLPAFERANEEDACLGAIIGNLMLDPVDLVLQHGLKRGERAGARE